MKLDGRADGLSSSRRVLGGGCYGLKFSRF
nr:MAG TPA: Atrial natriuretic peptide [Caudoviricetes sp.]DAT01790.1 MAG TPA: Atrial natriuretic peptide [Caudoviricetes sp.]